MFVVLLATLLHGEHRHWEWTFDKDALDAKPAGFYFDETSGAAPGEWKILEDQGRRVLAQLDRNRDGRRYALAVVRDSALNDLKVSVRMKAVEGKRDQAGGVVWRYRAPE